MSVASRLGFLAVLLAILAAASCERSESEAYVTLLYGDEFLLGVRVLGKSIRDTGSKKDMVVLVSDGVSDYAKILLLAEGWKVELISLLANPNQVRPTRFWGVYTKLKIFNMTKYKKVVYLDADTIVIKNIEDLFQCSKFCANLKHSERLNSGVMVVEPSATLFTDMMGKVTSLPSYTGGDQGFLNSYYSDFPNAHLFEPNISPEVRKSRPVPAMERLSTVYNADVGLYMLANKWMVDEKELRVIHYTLGPLKPWDWWTAWILKPVDLWQNIREQLEETLPGTGGGSIPNEQLLVRFLYVLPICALLLCWYRSYRQLNKDLFSCIGRSTFCDYGRRLYYRFRSGSGSPAYSGVGVSSSSITKSNLQFAGDMNPKLPAYLGVASIFCCFVAATFSLGLAFIVIPRQVMPWTGLLLMYEWTFTTFFVTFGCYLHFVHQWGRARASQSADVFLGEDPSDDSRKGHQRHTSGCDVITWFYGVAMAFLAVIVPSLPVLLGITALFVRLGLMVAGGLFFAAFMTYAAERLSIRAFVKGLENRDPPRTRSICVFC